MEKQMKSYDRVIDWLDRHGYKDIKANIEGYDTPMGFTQQKDGELLVPDVSAKSLSAKYYSEIAKKPKDKNIIQDLVSKWKLLSFMAKRKGGKLYLFAPYGSKSFVRDMMQQYNIDAELYYLKEQKIEQII
jgi:hypothetical protein